MELGKKTSLARLCLSSLAGAWRGETTNQQLLVALAETHFFLSFFLSFFLHRLQDEGRRSSMSCENGVTLDVLLGVRHSFLKLPAGASRLSFGLTAHARWQLLHLLAHRSGMYACLFVF